MALSGGSRPAGDRPSSRLAAGTELAGLLGWFAAASADVLELKDGKVLTGKYVGGTAGTIRFEADGSTQVIETGQALALTFSGGPSAAAAPAVASAAAPVPAAAPAASAPSAVSVPAGTTLLVQMVDGASSSDAKGKRFTTTLETDLVANGVMVAKAGTKVYGRVEGAQRAGRFAGQSSLDLRSSRPTERWWWPSRCSSPRSRAPRSGRSIATTVPRWTSSGTGS